MTENCYFDAFLVSYVRHIVAIW